MALRDLYALPADVSRWHVPQGFDAVFDWDFEPGRDKMLGLYRKGKRLQWDAEERIDWSLELDPENPEQLPDDALPVHGMPRYEALSRAEKANVRRHFQAWQISQFLQGEQGALVCTAKIVTQVPDMDSKFYAATQVADEARHVEAYAMLLQKFGVAYPMTPPLRELIDQVLRDSRWDITYLGMQVIIEGLALAAFQQIRDAAQNPLAASVNAYVMQDEARHVAFGRLALRDYYPQLGESERREREEFVVEACHLMRDRFNAVEVWDTVGLEAEACGAYMMESGFMQRFRSTLFTRIVPIVRDIGLWGDTVRNGYAKMGILGYADADVDAMQRSDEDVARGFDVRRAEVAATIAAGAKD